MTAAYLLDTIFIDLEKKAVCKKWLHKNIRAMSSCMPWYGTNICYASCNFHFDHYQCNIINVTL